MGDEERLRQQANRLELVSRWADDLAHEIKNPLHAMVINLELVKRRAGGDDPAPVVERAEVVESELHRVHELVDSLLRLVRPWPDTATATVHQLFDALLPVFRARARIRQIAYEHDRGEAMVTIPPGDLAQVLVNLVDLAIDATPEQGEVRTAVALGASDVRISVADTRPSGSAPDRAGLALAVSERLLEQAGGSLRLEERDGGGAEAVVTLPRAGSA